MTIPTGFLYAIQGLLVLAGVFLIWSGWQIRSFHRHELMRTIGTRVLEAPQVIEREYALYQTVFGLSLLAIDAAWIAFELSFATATIVTTAVTVIGTGWRGTLVRMHDLRRPR